MPASSWLHNIFKIYIKTIRNHVFINCCYDRYWNVPNVTNRICNHQEQFCFVITSLMYVLKSSHKGLSRLTEMRISFPLPSRLCVLVLFYKYLSKQNSFYQLPQENSKLLWQAHHHSTLQMSLMSFADIY